MKYFDTSAFVKYYGNDDLEKRVDKVSEQIELAKQGKVVLTSSFFLLGEALSVFDRWVRMKFITAEECELINSRFFKDIREMQEAGGLLLQDVDSLLIMFSLEFIRKHHLAINDAIHLYSAVTAVGVEEFWCSDEYLTKAAEKEMLNVVDPERE